MFDTVTSQIIPLIQNMRSRYKIDVIGATGDDLDKNDIIIERAVTRK